MIAETSNPSSEAVGTEAFLALFDQLERTSGNVPAWLRSIRHAGNAHFDELRFPTTAHEEWRYTPVSSIARLPANLAHHRSKKVSPAEIQKFTYGNLPGSRLVFIDGRFSLPLSHIEGAGDKLTILSIREAIAAGNVGLQRHLARYARADENPFVALNNSLLDDGAFLHISAGHVVENPILLLFITTSDTPGAITTPRVLIISERHSQACVIERYLSFTENAHFTNAVTELFLDSGAKLEHCKVQEENLNAFHVATVQSYQLENSNLITHSISIGAALTRNNINPVLDASGCECTMNGLYLGRGTQLVDHHTAITHAKPHCNSHEFYHGILDDRSTGVFNGKIFVRPDAQKTDAKQTNRNLLLSDDATINTKPQLEIFADDVKCTHGATVGQLEEEAIFYLRARGIGLESARRMLVHAFASDILNRISIAPVRQELDEQMFNLYERDPQPRLS